MTMGLDNFDGPHYAQILLRLVFSAVLAAFVAYRPWRLLMKRPKPTRETAQAQMLVAVAGSLMVVVIGDSVARAFGLVGLGALVRFRSGLKDPRDAAVMFGMIAIGMACGMGLLPVAVVAAVFSAALLALLDSTGSDQVKRLRLSITLEHPTAAVPLLRTVFPGARLLELPQAGGEGSVVLEVDAAEALDAAGVLERLEKHNVQGVKHIALLVE
jgi:hypothetical protein